MTTNLPVSTQTLPALGLQVEHLLTKTQTVEDAASAFIADGLVEELRAKVPVLYAKARETKCNLAGIKRAITPWFATYPQPERSEPEWTAFWHGYVVACGHLPPDAIKGALERWVKQPGSEFLPKPGKLGEMAAATPSSVYLLTGRAHQVLQLIDDMQDRQRIAANMERDEIKPADQVQAVAELLAGFQAQSIPARERAARILQRGVAGADIPDADLPYIGGECATGSALTPQMLKLMGWPVPPPRDPGELVTFSDGI